MIPVPDMSALIARLEAAEAGSRELDAAVWAASNGYELVRFDGAGWLYKMHADDIQRHERTGFIPGFSQSLDAALALADRVLPGQEYEITTLYNVARVTLNMNHGDEGGPYYGSNDCCNVPLAICAAVLKSIPNRCEAAGEVSPNLKAKAQGEGG